MPTRHTGGSRAGGLQIDYVPSDGLDQTERDGRWLVVLEFDT